MAVQTLRQPAACELESYLPVAVANLVPTAVLDFDLYLQVGGEKRVVLFRERNYPLEQRDLDRLAAQAVLSLYVHVDNAAAYRRYLFDQVVRNVGAEPIKRYQVLTTATRSAFNAAFRSVGADSMVHFAGDFGQYLTEIVCSNEVRMFELLCLMQHDRDTFTHCVNVCTCSVLLAKALGNGAQSDLRTVAAGAMMHDVGKRHLPAFLLKKSGELSERDRAAIRAHPQIGFEELCLRGDMTWGELMMVYQHHERIDGRGYPARLTGTEIWESARICAIADVYDALRSDRSHHKAWRMEDVREYLESASGRHLDGEMVRCWNSVINCKS